MRLRTLFAGLLSVTLLPTSAFAEVKSYTIDVLRVLNTTTLTVTGQSHCTGCTQGTFITGDITIIDASNASPTLAVFDLKNGRTRTTRTDVFAGLNSYVYTRSLQTTFPLSGQTGTGDTEGFLQWNPLSSWTPIGGQFCASSNEIGAPLGGPICPLVSFSQQMTIAATVPSPSYDFPLWTFDVMRDISSDSYLWQISSNGSSNGEYFIRAELTIDIPSMSIFGFGVLGASLLFLGLRTIRSRRKRD